MKLVLVLIGLALAARLLPHPDNFTPLLAVALFSGAMLPGRAGYIVPLAAMFASDMLIGYPFDLASPVVYASLAAGVLLGRRLESGRTLARTVGSALAGSVLFFVATNFAVWAMPGGMYAHTVQGLVDCYTLALPFFRNGLAGDLFWSVALFGAYDLARRLPLARARAA